MPTSGLLAAVLLLVAVPRAMLAQRSAQLAFADPQPHFVAAWAPEAESAAERSSVLARRVSLQLSEAPLDAALKALTSRAQLRLTYSPALLPQGMRVTINASDVAVVTALTEMLFRSGLDVVVDRDGVLALVPCRHSNSAARRQAPDTGTIVGRVTDKTTGSPIAGATVAVEGTERAVMTKGQGQFHITGLAAGTYQLRARYIGYTPLVASALVTADAESTVEFALERSAQQLDQVVVTGNLVATERRTIPTPITVVTGEEMQERHLQRVDQLFRGDVPGSIAWDQPSKDYYSSISVRGASSFTTNSIKTFVDGVEVAYPVFVATIDPSSIERVEVTRGPQGSTLYGSEAVAGVMQIFTKKGEAGRSRPLIDATSSLGVIGNSGISGSSVKQDHALSVLGGTATSGFTLGGTYTRTGEWTPAYSSRGWNFFTGAQTSHGPLNVSASARYAAKDWDSPWVTSLRPLTMFSQPPFEDNRLRQQTYGITANYQAGSRWGHTLTLGYDQTLQGYENTQARFTTPADSLLSSFSGVQSKSSIFYHTTVEARLSASVGTTVTAGVNHTAYGDESAFTANATRTDGNLDGQSFLSRTASRNTGIFGQIQLSIAEAVFLTGGLRAERNANFGAQFGTALSPRAGISYVRPIGPWTLKLRSSYGESIRAPLPFQSTPRPGVFANQLGNPRLGPERQRGLDGGLELYFGTRGSLGVTYYNQSARDLIDLVLLGDGASPPNYQYQNVGRINNHGWEVEGRLGVGRLDIKGTFSTTSSTAKRLAPNYTGDYRTGDRVLDIPRTTASTTATYRAGHATALSLTWTHIGSWVQTDWVAFYGYLLGGEPFRGSNRDYWMMYPSIDKLSLGASQDLSQQVSAFLQADNVGNNRRFESSNINPSMGRTLTLGLRARY
jgi:outer membrane receptor protein involved in Fe transport